MSSTNSSKTSTPQSRPSVSQQSQTTVSSVSQEATFSVRRANKTDEDGIASMIGEETFLAQKRFGEHTISNLLEMSFLSIVCCKNDDEIVGFAAFHTSAGPILHNVDNKLIPTNWEPYMKQHYATKNFHVCKNLLFTK